MLIKEITYEVFNNTKIKKELDTFEESFSLFFEAVKIEPIKDDSSYDELMNLMGDAILKFNAARKGIGLVNKLKNSEERKKHRSAVMSNMNKLRGLMQRIDKKIAGISKNETT